MPSKTQIKNFIREVRKTQDKRIADSLGGGGLDALTLPTVASSVNGGIWLDVTGSTPVIKIFYGGTTYTLSGTTSATTGNP